MLIKYNNYLINIEKHKTISRTTFSLSSQSFFVIQIKNNYDDEQIEIVYYRTLSEYLNDLASFFVLYYVYYEKFELYYWDRKNNISKFFINFNKEQYNNLSNLFLKLYNANKI